MTTAIEDSELNTELQELYLVNKQWIADLDFLETELDFLKKLTAKILIREERARELDKLIVIDKTYHGLKTDMMGYLHHSEALITHTPQKFDLHLIETYTDLKQRLSNIMVDCHMVKNAIFACSKHESLQPDDNVSISK